MAINWLVALKAVPWTDLVQAAPHIVKGARRLFTSTRAGEASESEAGARPRQRGAADARLSEIETALDTLNAEQRASAELIRSLAEQNARVIEAMEVLRARARIMFAWCTALTVALVVLVVWMVTR